WDIVPVLDSKVFYCATMMAANPYQGDILSSGQGRDTALSNHGNAVASPAASLPTQRTAPGVEALAQSFLDNLLFVQGRSMERATSNDLYMALAHTVRDRLVERWTSTVGNYVSQDVRVVC